MQKQKNLQHMHESRQSKHGFQSEHQFSSSPSHSREKLSFRLADCRLGQRILSWSLLPIVAQDIALGIGIRGTCGTLGSHLESYPYWLDPFLSSQNHHILASFVLTATNFQRTRGGIPNKYTKWWTLCGRKIPLELWSLISSKSLY